MEMAVVFMTAFIYNKGTVLKKDNNINKLAKLKKIISGLDTAIVAYSGGTDSSLLLKVASEMMGDRVIAVTAVSPTYPGNDFIRAREITKEFGVKHLLIKTNEMADSKFTDNKPDRCYLCKSHFYKLLSRMAEKMKIGYLLAGNNKDDLNDYRPGMKAAREFGVRSPLMEAGLTKKDVRRISASYGLSTAGTPSSPCLASRLPYGQKITEKALSMVDRSESYLRAFGIKELRVRHYDHTAKIEVGKADVNKILKKSK